MKKLLLSLSIAAMSISAAQAETVYFQEDFEWLEPWCEVAGVHDFINASDEVKAESKNLTTAVDEVSAYDALLSRGYTFVQAKHHNDSKYAARTLDKIMYLQKNYLKMGLTGYHAGIVLPALKEIPADKQLKISFDWTPMRQGDPGAENRKYDPSELVVVIANGDDERQVAVPAHTLAAGDEYAWMHADISLDGQTVNENTKITIRQIDSQWPYLDDQNTSKVCRWFIDNIKVYSEDASSIDEIGIDMDAPIEYYNMLGVRVENPGNGLYIVKQGNKTAKKFIVR